MTVSAIVAFEIKHAKTVFLADILGGAITREQQIFCIPHIVCVAVTIVVIELGIVRTRNPDIIIQVANILNMGSEFDQLPIAATGHTFLCYQTGSGGDVEGCGGYGIDNGLTQNHEIGAGGTGGIALFEAAAIIHIGQGLVVARGRVGTAVHISAKLEMEKNGFVETVCPVTDTKQISMSGIQYALCFRLGAAIVVIKDHDAFLCIVKSMYIAMIIHPDLRIAGSGAAGAEVIKTGFLRSEAIPGIIVQAVIIVVLENFLGEVAGIGFRTIEFMHPFIEFAEARCYRFSIDLDAVFALFFEAITVVILDKKGETHVLWYADAAGIALVIAIGSGIHFGIDMVVKVAQAPADFFAVTVGLDRDDDYIVSLVAILRSQVIQGSKQSKKQIGEFLFHKIKM